MQIAKCKTIIRAYPRSSAATLLPFLFLNVGADLEVGLNNLTPCLWLVLLGMNKDTLGLLQVYTGPGKGKTTAAVGLAVRAAGQGLRVAFIQFMKPQASGELKVLERLAGVTVAHFGAPGWFSRKADVPRHEGVPHYEAALRGWRAALRYLKAEEETDLLVLDELCTALSSQLLDEEEALSAVLNRPHGLEVVCTGRNAPKKLIRAADLVTEMLEIKHYFKRGVQARKGIEY